MCGRISLYHTERVVFDMFHVSVPTIEPRYNIAPTQNVAVIRPDGFAWMRWGLIPSWSKEPTTRYATFNARAETVATKPTFRSAYKSRRCLVLASGFYEWERIGKRKRPHYLQQQDGGILAFAGLWERWDRGQTPVESCTIICTEANELLQAFHDRMPVILDPEQFTSWMQGNSPQELLRPYPAAKMRDIRVKDFVNNARHDASDCIDPLED